MNKARFGTLMIGVLLVSLGISFLDNIANSVAPTDWYSLLKKDSIVFEENADRILSQLDNSFINQGITENEWLADNKAIESRVQEGRRKIFYCIEELKNLEAIYFLMSYPAKLFLYESICMLILVVGLGLCIGFPWSMLFVLFSVCVSYLWQAYIYLFDQKVAETLFYYQEGIARQLNLPIKTPVPSYLNLKTQLEVLYTIVFIGVVYYLCTAQVKEYFRARREARWRRMKEKSLKEPT